ncbi:ABC transporter permease [Sulfidibacter corallicola]|uniref:ABC transporter permease n=1 Tax=Sulfidibacter corallicola TaxID=2818388 RepID=A0A8A4TPH8_SULCO|nr:ABC transporter permease [Sulfidibacter corallicola]QTD51450.1 ABC transporter permease [Sulfidibacter corallicola]
MFDYDKWQEILATVRRNKLRTLLTMFGVFWGLFLLLLLLGSGQGLENGVGSSFDGWATNSGFIWPRRTTKPYRGLQPGRRARFTEDDIPALRAALPGLDALAPRAQLGGFRGSNNVFRGDRTGGFSVYGDVPAYQRISLTDMLVGRHINPLDIEGKRKVAVIGTDVLSVLFDEGEEPIGEYIRINGVFFQVVGVHKSRRTGGDGDRDAQSIYIPLSAYQQAFGEGKRFHWYAYSAKPGVSVNELEGQMMAAIRERHRIHPEDRNALGHNNLEEEFQQLTGLFGGIRAFVWFVGIGTLLAGVIGVSNIMLIVVKERTREIGIRKAIGATPWSIVALIMQEALLLTGFAGYLGLLCGVAVLEAVNRALGTDAGVFLYPAVSLTTAGLAFAVLVLCGCLAGLIPARRAASIRPIEAIQV